MLTTAGRDFVAGALSDRSGSRPAAADYLALTANTTAPSAASTTLTGEITTASGGLVRAQATYAHTGGASSYTLTKTFTSNGSDSLPAVVAKIGVFNASSAGTLVLETLLGSTFPFGVSGSSLTVTATVTVATNSVAVVTYTASTATIANPERGYYQDTGSHYYTDTTGHTALSSSTMASARTGDAETYVFRIYIMEKFFSQDTIDSAWLTLLAADLAAVRTAGCKAIIRFAYSSSNSTSGPYDSEPVVARVLSHIAQIAPTINAAADVVDIVEAGFIGTWGEWYYTDNFGDQGTVSAAQYNDRLRVLAALLDNLDPRIFVQLRYPGLKARWF